MKTSRTFWMVLFVLALGGLMSLLAFYEGLDRTHHERFLTHLQRLEQLDTLLDRDISLARQGQLAHFDPFHQHLSEMSKEIQSLLIEHTQNRQWAKPQLLALEKRQHQKERLVQYFASDLAVLRNSQAYLPTAIRRLAKELSLKPDTWDKKDLNEFLTTLHTLLRAVTVSSRPGVTNQDHEIPLMVQRLRQFKPDHTSESHLSHLLSHVERVIQFKIRVESIMTQALAIQLVDSITELRHHEALRFNRELKRMNEFRRLLFVMSLILMLFGLITWVKLRQKAQLLTDKQQQLSSSLQKLKQETSERRLVMDKLRILDWAMEQSPVSVIITDRKGTIQYVNTRCCQSSGYTREILTGQSPGILKSGDMEASEYAHLWSTITSGKEWFGEFHNRRQDGSLYWEAASISPILDKKGKTTHFVAVKEDITQKKEIEKEREQERKALKQAKEAAEAANRAKSSFLAMMSHEIRTPMNAILGMTELLQEHPTKEERKAYLAVQKRAGTALLTLIDDILELLRLDAGIEKSNAAPFDLPMLCHAVASLLDRAAIEKGLTIQVKIADQLPTIWLGDERRIRQVLINLIGNAIKFTNQGLIRIETAFCDKNSEQICIFVTDTGIGIPPEHVERIFGLFYQVDSSDTREYGGSGLGLTITHKLTTLMGGTITCKSIVGKGTTFTLRLPLIPSSPKEAKKTAKKQVKHKIETPAMQVLLAEDSPDNAMLVRSYLKKTRIHLTVVEDGAQALEKVRSNHFDIILMDMQMPVMDGYEATRKIRQESQQQIILALTAHAMEGDREKCLAAGCSGYLTKPIKKQTLIKALLEHAPVS
ncbi:DAHL domain-containing protein [Magnetococcales bacterium HHB-1]